MLLLLVPRAAAQDAPFADADAGVFEVRDASLSDGGQLGQGWWLSAPRMQKVGEHVVALENENARLRFEGSETFRPTVGFWIGLAVGFGAGVAGTVILVNQLRR